MSNPCDTPEQCLAALAELRVQQNRLDMERRHVQEILLGQVIHGIRNGTLPETVVKIDERALHAALRGRKR